MSLFRRFFLNIWLVSMLFVLCFFSLLHYGGVLNRNASNLEHWPQRAEAVSTLNKLSRIAETRGVDGITQWLDRSPRLIARQFYVFDHRNKPLIKRRGKHLARDISTELTEESPYLTDVRKGRPVIGRYVYVGNANYVKIFVIGPPSLAAKVAGLLARYAWVSVLFAALLSGIAALILARATTNPISILRRATKSELDANNPALSELATRSDELGDLARDFASMTERLDKAFKEQQQLISNISHELRTPLTRIQLNNELASMKPAAQQKLHFANIEGEINKLNGIISDVLALESFGQYQLKSQPINLITHLDTAIKNIQFRARNTLISTAFSQAEVTTEAFGGLLDQAFDNLLNNAARHSPNSPILVSLEVDKGNAIIEFRDSGTGVPEELLERIFSPFVRSDDARSEDRGGVGLGLALTKKIIEHHKGTISAKNNSEGGLSVIISLPMTS